MTTPHGYENDSAALRAIICLYHARCLDALRVYYDTSRASTHAADQATLHTWARWLIAHDALATYWANGRLDRPVHGGAPFKDDAARTAWMEIVEADMRARLTGDMGRPLPEPDAYVPEAPAEVTDVAIEARASALGRIEVTPEGALVRNQPERN